MQNQHQRNRHRQWASLLTLADMDRPRDGVGMLGLHGSTQTMHTVIACSGGHTHTSTHISAHTHQHTHTHTYTHVHTHTHTHKGVYTQSLCTVWRHAQACMLPCRRASLAEVSKGTQLRQLACSCGGCNGKEGKGTVMAVNPRRLLQLEGAMCAVLQ